MCNILLNTIYTIVIQSQIKQAESFNQNMKKQLKCLDETISEIEREVEENPHPFLVSTLERLRFYRDNELDKVVERIERINVENSDQLKGGFRGYGFS